MSPESLPIKLRQARGSMSLTEAAERSGVPEERIRMYEDGERRPYGKTLRRLAEAYGIPAAELAGGVVAESRAGRAKPAVVRRRRRRRAGEAGAVQRIEVPVEVPVDGEVRLVIELVLRAKPVASRPAPALEVTTPAPARAPAVPLAPAIAARPQHGGRGNGGRTVNEPRDPLAEFRRAYHDFRSGHRR